MNDKLLDYLIATDSLDEFLGDKSKCPHCGSKLTKIEYGMPGPEIMERVENGEVFIGGCCIYDDEMPEYHCNNCRRSYTQDLKKYIEEPNNFEEYNN